MSKFHGNDAARVRNCGHERFCWSCRSNQGPGKVAFGDSELTRFSALSDADDRRLRMSALAVLANGSLSRLSHVVKRLERRGWVDRSPCPGDRRSTFAHLTDAGYAKFVAAAPGYVENVRNLVVDKLSEEQLAQLIGIGRSLNESVPRIS